ncbi:hypothetical protein FS749_014838 [Ceratobasidium sp. UAMH 11750]|nr:hypothetical protein FS749_014838 [Ceratobasidium sp. UAMH 11750]
MPAEDPADQQAARDFESSLREAVAQLERPPIELNWFSALPKRVRRSARLLKVAEADARVLLEHVRADWVKTRQAEREQAERLARAKALPRDLECLRAPDPAAWNGLGRRKKRCRAFEGVGRAFNTRQRAAGTTSPAQQTLVDIQTVQTSPLTVPDRPPTPPGLREAAFGCVGLLASASGVNAYGHNTPYPMPPLPTRVVRRPPSPVPPPKPHPAYEGETTIGGVEVDWRIAYIIALGRHARYPHRPPSTLRKAAENVLDAELLHPGVLTCLSELFFPHGFDDWTLARPRLLYILDFCSGWFALAPEH